MDGQSFPPSPPAAAPEREHAAASAMEAGFAGSKIVSLTEWRQSRQGRSSPGRRQ